MPTFWMSFLFAVTISSHFTFFVLFHSSDILSNCNVALSNLNIDEFSHGSRVGSLESDNNRDAKCIKSVQRCPLARFDNADRPQVL